MVVTINVCTNPKKPIGLYKELVVLENIGGASDANPTRGGEGREKNPPPPRYPTSIIYSVHKTSTDPN
jgi:hypothetical protein